MSSVSTSSGLPTRIGALRRVAHGALDLFVAGVTDEQDLGVRLGEPDRLAVHLGHQRAGGVDRLQLAVGGGLHHHRRDAVRAEDEVRARWAPRRPRRRRSRRASPARSRRARCARSACARRPGRRSARAPSRRRSPPGRRRRSIRGAPPAARASSPATGRSRRRSRCAGILGGSRVTPSAPFVIPPTLRFYGPGSLPPPRSPDRATLAGDERRSPDPARDRRRAGDSGRPVARRRARREAQGLHRQARHGLGRGRDHPVGRSQRQRLRQAQGPRPGRHDLVHGLELDDREAHRGVQAGRPRHRAAEAGLLDQGRHASRCRSTSCGTSDSATCSSGSSGCDASSPRRGCSPSTARCRCPSCPAASA